jgi:threonine dehydrogenase-like Zn-dependent dehydrogenase
MTHGRGADSVVEAVGMEAHGSLVGRLAQTVAGLVPDRAAAPLMSRVGMDRMAALLEAIEIVRRGGTISVIGVYGGMTDPLPMLRMFDKGVTLRMGQAHVRRWIDALMPLVTDDADPLGVEGLATHHLPLDEAPHGYEIFQKKQEGALKVVLNP